MSWQVEDFNRKERKVGRKGRKEKPLSWRKKASAQWAQSSQAGFVRRKRTATLSSYWIVHP